MKKTSILLATAFIASTLLTACGSGANTRSMNENRGAAGSHVSGAQARQYARQQQLESNEVRLENMKRRQNTDAIKEGAGAVRSAASAIHSLDSLRSLF
ncbi:MAG: hypothetical protein KAH00_08835 [Cocleimonas sp.]|nr:hypothetical protein [Cocleimonas sp.]